MPEYKNAFKSPDHCDHAIVNGETGRAVGTLRVKPARLLWKPAWAREFTSVKLEDFVAWLSEPNTKTWQTGS
jgi:hypothetical protein